MTLSLRIRKVFQGVPDRRQMFRMLDRHEQHPDRTGGNTDSLYAGEWFEVAEDDYQYMFDIQPPLWIEWDKFAVRACLTGKITSIFFVLNYQSQPRCFHGYCDLAEHNSPERMQAAIIERESRPLKVLTREERLEHIWSSTHDEYRGYADWRCPSARRGERIVMVCGPDRRRDYKVLDRLTDAEIAAKLPVHLRHLPDDIAA